MKNVSDSLISIQIHIIKSSFEGNDPTPRLVVWAIAALKREGRDEAMVIRMIGNRPLTGQWWVLRQLLTDKAIYVLEEKLADYGNEKSDR